MERENGVAKKSLIQKLVSGGQTGADRAGIVSLFAQSHLCLLVIFVLHNPTHYQA
jgi:hypothetical protein